MVCGMAESLFDLADEYASLLDRGLRLSGEDRHYFMRGRIRELRRQIGSDFQPARILDFGCGTGDTARALAEEFPGARILGVDTAERALAHAQRTYGGNRIGFAHLDDFAARAEFDLCYVNGVFHHIDPDERPPALSRIRDALVAGGRLAFFENNPWNPGTRLVMARIPFDRDARPISPRLARRLLEAAGFAGLRVRSLFYFPRALRALRGLEPLLAPLPLGAQYCLIAERSS
jgi:SAM-dependent methyltransferase